jgi:hypothetical protein
MDVKTVDRYLGLLEGAYILRRLGGFSRNLRKEVAKSRKVFFLDLGIRNALLNAFQPPPLRDDMGRLWENYLVLERHKQLVYVPVRVEPRVESSWNSAVRPWFNVQRLELLPDVVRQVGVPHVEGVFLVRRPAESRQPGQGIPPGK